MTAEMTVHNDFTFRENRWMLLVDSRGRFASFGRACQLLGIPVAREWARVQKYPEIASLTRIEYVGGEPVYLMQAEAVPTWLLIIPPGEVPESTRRLRAEMTRELVPAIYDFVTTGVAVSSRLTPLEVAERIADKIIRWGGDSEHDRIIAHSLLRSRAALEVGAAAGGEMPVTVAARVQELGEKMGQDDVQRIGQLVATEYRRRNPGRNPGTTMQWIKGRPTPVKSYRQSDLSWIDGIINDYVRRRPFR